MKFSITVEFKASNKENAQKTAAIIHKLLEQIPEEEITQFYELLQKRPTIIKEFLSKVNNPLLQKLFK